MLKHKRKISILLLSFIFIASFMLLQNNMSKTLSATSVPSFQTYEKIKIANDTYTVISEENGIVKALMDSTTGNAQVWSSANTVAKGYSSNLGTLGSTVLSGTYQLPTSNDLTPITETNTLNTNIPKVTSDWWLGDASVDNRSKFVSNDNLLDKEIELIDSAVINNTCGTKTTTEHGIMATEDYVGAAATFTKTSGSGGLWAKGGNNGGSGNPPYPTEYYTGRDCTGSRAYYGGWGPYFNQTSESGSKWPIKIEADGKINPNSTGAGVVAMLKAVGVDVTTLTPGTWATIKTVPNKCYNVDQYSSTGVFYARGYANGEQVTAGTEFRSFIDLGSARTESPFYLAGIDGFKTEEITCEGKPHNAGTATVRPMVALPTQAIAFANTNKRNFTLTQDNSLSSTFPTSDTGNTKPYLTLRSNDLNVTLNSSANGVSGATLKTEMPSDGKLEIPVSITGEKEGAQYISAKANINGVEQYGILKQVSTANDTVLLDVNNFSSKSDISTLDQITFTLYVEDEGMGDTAYISSGTEITIKIVKPQTIDFDADQANTLTYGDTLTLNASTTSSDISTEPLTFSIDDPTKASITEQNYDASNGTAYAVITPKTGTGTVIVTIEKAGDENVSAAQADTHIINLQTKAITVSAGKPSRIYAIGETMPSFTSECHDLVSGDTLPTSLIPSLEPLNNSAQKPDQNGMIHAIGTWKLVYSNDVLSTLTDFTNKYNVTLYDYDDDNTLIFETSIKELPENWIQVTPNANKNGWNNTSVTIEPTQLAISSGFTTIELDDGTQSGASIVYSTDTTISGVTPKVRLRKGTHVTDPLEVRNILIDQVNPTAFISVEKETEWATKKLVTITATDGLSGIDTVTVKKGNDPVAISGSGPYTFTASAVGTYDIIVTDRAGNTSTIQKEITMIDTSKISITATPETVTSDVPRQKITVSYQAGASGIKSFKVYYKASTSDAYTVLDGSLDQTKNPLEWYAEMNGIYQFELINNANETVKSDEIEITRVNPPVPVTQITAHVKGDQTKAYSSNTWINQNIILNVSNANTDVTETVSWEYSNDGTNWTSLSGTSLEVSEVAYSTQTIQFRGSTSKASEQSPKAFTVKIDKTSPNKPVVKDIEKYTQSTWHKDDITLSVSVPNKASSIRQDIYVCEGTKANCDTNPAMWTQTNGTLPFTGNGTHELYFKTIDEAGNEITLQDAVYVNINSTKPVITIKIENDPLATWLHNATLGIFFNKIVSIDLEVNYGQGQSGNVYYIIESDDTKPAPTDNDSRWKLGTHENITPDAKGKVYVKAISDAGVISYKDSELSIYADQTPPVITLPNTMSDWTNDPVIQVEVTDNLSGVDTNSVMIQEGQDPARAVTLSNHQASITLMKDGSYDVTVSASDYSTNAGSSQTHVMIDTTAPVISTPTPDISGVAKQKTITFTLEDVSSGIDSYQVVDSKNKDISVTKNPDGSYSFVITYNDTYSITAIDKVGNDITRTYTETNIDHIGPDIENIVISDKLIYRPRKTVSFDVTDVLSSIQLVTVSYVKNGQTYTVPVNDPTSGDTYTFTANENTTYTIKATDSVGNETTVEVTVSMIDTSGIRIVDISDISTWTKDTKDVSFAIDSKTGIATDFPKVMYNGSLVNYTLSNGKYTFTAIDTGTYEILAEDQAGLDTSETLTITKIDKGSPTITNISNNNTASDWRGPQTISFHASDSESGLKQGYPKISIMVDGVKKNINVIQDSTDPTLWTFLAEYNGTYTIEVQDVVEHPVVVENVPVDHILTPDMMTPIQVSALSNGKAINSGTWTSKKITFTISGGLDASILEKYQVAITNGSQPSDTDFIDLNIDTSHHEVTTDVKDAVYWFRAYPVLSNTVSTPFTVNIDGTPPDHLTVTKQAINANAIARFINFMSLGQWMNEAQEISFHAQDNLTPQADIKYFYYEEKNGVPATTPVTWKPYTGPLTYRDVDITLNVKAVDLAGNESAVHPESLQIDSVPPVINGAKDQKEYKYYYVPRYITVTDEGSGIAKTSYKKDGGEETIFNNEVKLDLVGNYELYTSDIAGNEKNITFKIVALPLLDDIDGSDESKKIIDQVQQELDEVKGKIDSDELTNYEKWIDEATEKWKKGRETVLVHDETGTKVEGSEGTSFDPDTILVVKDMDLEKLPNLPKNAFKGYDVSLMKDGVKINPMGNVTVYLPYNKKEKPILYEVNKDGTTKEITFTMRDGYLIFTTDELKQYVLAEKKVDEPFECTIEDGEILNKDTDGDGRPDLNIDYDGDCIADLNIDTNNDGIPDLDIDINGDGKPEYNIDVGKDGSADENIIKIEKWQPDKDCEYNGFKYDTMSDPTKKPDDTNNPDDPNNPDNPNNPDDPNNPDNPTNPDDSNKPDDSNNPDKPNDPNTPTNPDDSDKPNGSNNGKNPNQSNDSNSGKDTTNNNGSSNTTRVDGTYTNKGVGGANTGDISNMSVYLFTGSISLYLLWMVYKKRNYHV